VNCFNGDVDWVRDCITAMHNDLGSTQDIEEIAGCSGHTMTLGHYQGDKAVIIKGDHGAKEIYAVKDCQPPDITNGQCAPMVADARRSLD
jgi:hypothetical protein